MAVNLASCIQRYETVVLKRPWLTLSVIAALVVLSAYHIPGFQLDASADTLVLENDQDLKYYRSIRARYGSDDYLIVTYTPHADLFSDAVLADLQALSNELGSLERVNSVVSILNVPLISSPVMTISEMEQDIRTLLDVDTDRELARKEFTTSPLYANFLVSPDGGTTALQVRFHRDETYHRLLEQRDQLREKRLHTDLSAAESEQLRQASDQFASYSASLLDQEHEDIVRIRQIMDRHRPHADLYLGGVPMIVADSMQFIRHDLATFGIGVLVFLILILSVAFRKPRWVFIPMLTCFATGIMMVGFLGFMGWKVTVVSSNFISLLLIITLSLTVHLIVRYRELHAQMPQADQLTLVSQTLRSKAIPSFYTAITTMVAFASLLVSDIRPVIDFGLMMVIGIALALFLAFTLFPAALMLLQPGEPAERKDLTAAITAFFARLIERFRKGTLFVYVTLAILSAAGISLLTVENRFIDHYKESTEIYRGMELIDLRLGGTTPLDVILEAPADFHAASDEEIDLEDDIFEDPFSDDTLSSTGITGSYWFNNIRLGTVNAVHSYLDQLNETGKVLSIDTTIRILRDIPDSRTGDDFMLSILYERLPQDTRDVLFAPYMSDEGNQIRFSIRLFESDVSLQRNALLNKISRHLDKEIPLQGAQFHLTGMAVLYNNLLQSLFRSQILTIGVVFLAILIMFRILFRSMKLASIAIVPNIISAGLVLGLMGWLGIPLDIMTITIAAIVIGIAVDDTIHYVHRYTTEFMIDRDGWATVRRCHASIGRAMYYTSVTITLGFSILALSNFMPTIYFGLLTGFAMIVALVANLTLLPLLLVLFKPFSTRHRTVNVAL